MQTLGNSGCPAPLRKVVAVVNMAWLRSEAGRELLTGYALQLMSAVLLLGQHFLLPIALGVDSYGRLAFMTGAASLLSIGYDHGCNLLAVRKPALAWHYLAIKLALLLLIGVPGGVWVLANGQASFGIVLSVALHATVFVLYTFYVHIDIAIGKIRRVFWYSMANGLLLLVVPLAFHKLEVDLAYAPAVGCVLSLLLLLSTRGVLVGGQGPHRILSVRLKASRVKPLLIKQFQISLGTVLDGGIVWAGVLVTAALEGYEAAGIYRIAMSIVGLMTQLLPMPKQVLLRLARQSPRTDWSRRYALGLVATGALQAALVYGIGLWALSLIFTDKAAPIHAALLTLSAVPAMRALFELQTILHDKHNTLGSLVRNTCIAATCAIVVYPQGVVVMVVFFYGLLTLLGASRLWRH